MLLKASVKVVPAFITASVRNEPIKLTVLNDTPPANNAGRKGAVIVPQSQEYSVLYVSPDSVPALRLLVKIACINAVASCGVPNEKAVISAPRKFADELMGLSVN